VQDKVPLVGMMALMVQTMQSVLDTRIAAKGRRTASSWFRFARVKDDWDCFYDTLILMGNTVRL
jgi:hypothetical protein